MLGRGVGVWVWWLPPHLYLPLCPHPLSLPAPLLPVGGGWEGGSWRSVGVSGWNGGARGTPHCDACEVGFSDLLSWLEGGLLFQGLLAPSAGELLKLSSSSMPLVASY